MEIRRICILLARLALVLCPVLGRGQQPALDSARQAAKAQATIDWLPERLWIREATGNNDGPAVAGLIRAGGGVPAEKPEYCGFTQAADQKANLLPIPVGAGGSYNWFLPKNPRTYYLRATRGQLASIRVGHPVGLYSLRKGRICHITRVVAIVPGMRRGQSPRGFYCIGGNEGTGTKAGMHLTFYPASAIYAAANWLY